MSNCSDRRRQRGSAFIESMLGVAIVGVIGAGTAQIAARIAVGQRELRAEGIALAQMRQMLVTDGSALCGGAVRTIELPDNVVASMQPADCPATPLKLVVEPSRNDPDPAVPRSLEVEAVTPVTMKVRLSNLRIHGNGDAEMEVGTRT